MASAVLSFKEVDVSKIKFAHPKRTPTGRVVVSISYEGKRLCVRGPSMSAPFGTSTYGDAPNLRHSLDLSFRGIAETTELQDYQTFLYRVDSAAKAYIKANSMEIFGRKKPISDDTLDETYVPSIKVSKEPEVYAPVIRFKIPTNREGEPISDAYLNKHEKKNILEVVKGSTCICICEPQMWFLGKTQCGLTWRLHQVRIKEPPKKLDYQFEDEDEVDDVSDVGGGGSILEGASNRDPLEDLPEQEF